MQKEFTDDVLSVYTVSSLKAVRHRYIFCIYGVLGISVCSPGLVYLGRMCGSASRRLSGARGQINWQNKMKQNHVALSFYRWVNQTQKQT